MPFLSVIICAHDPRDDFLARTLEALRRQTLSFDDWELLLIDNGSSVPLASRVDLTWHPRGRHIHEPELGLTPARLRGIREAGGDLLVFVDDDNVLDSHYLEIACGIAREWPRIGVFGGSQIPEYEVPPDEDILAIAFYLATRTVPRLTWTNVKGVIEALPVGAGLCIRRHLAVRYSEQVADNPLRRMLDRSGRDGFLSSGDFDMAFTVCDFGCGMLITPALVLTHLIGKKRIDKAYLLKLIEGTCASWVILSHVHDIHPWKPGRCVFVRGCARVLWQRGRFKRQVEIARLKGKLKGLKILRQKSGLGLP